MALDVYDYLFWGNYNKRISDLSNMALDEPWSFVGKNDNSILKNYLKYTFYKLQEENKILELDNYCIFNTGLFTNYYEQIFVQGEKDLSLTQESKWRFKRFCTKFELGFLDIAKLPERADYFLDPSLLVFDWRCDININ